MIWDISLPSISSWILKALSRSLHPLPSMPVPCFTLTIMCRYLPPAHCPLYFSLKQSFWGSQVVVDYNKESGLNSTTAFEIRAIKFCSNINIEKTFLAIVLAWCLWLNFPQHFLKMGKWCHPFKLKCRRKN